jgi:hypothetical protein
MKLSRLPRFHLRDLFWLVLMVALVLGWWMDRNRLATEVKYLKSTVNGVGFIETELSDALTFLSNKHNIGIAADWKSLKTSPKTIVTHQLLDGSLPYQVHQLFLGHEAVDVTWNVDGVLITGNHPAEEQP